MLDQQNVSTQRARVPRTYYLLSKSSKSSTHNLNDMITFDEGPLLESRILLYRLGSE